MAEVERLNRCIVCCQNANSSYGNIKEDNDKMNLGVEVWTVTTREDGYLRENKLDCCIENMLKNKKRNKVSRKMVGAGY